MNVPLSIRQYGIVFCLVAGLFLLLSPGADAATRSFEERYKNHFCQAYHNRGFDPAFCDAEEPEPDAPTLELNAGQLLVPVGATTTLSWTSEDADTCTASGGWSGAKATDGSQVVTINATTTYSLTCSGEGGTTTDSVVVAAKTTPQPDPEPEVPVVEIDADDLFVLIGGTTTLFWDSANADTCTASGGWSGTKATEGSQVVTVIATTTYTITCTGEGGQDSESLVIGALIPEEPEPEASLEFTAEPNIVDIGSTTTLTWSATDLDTCEASGDWSGAKALSGSEEIMIEESGTFNLTCSDGDTNISKSIAVTVFEEPEPEVSGVLITEVLYDVVSGGAQGAESANEWVEIYNPTDSAVDLMNWEIGDGTSNDVISTTSLILAPGGHLIITNATTTANFWDFTGKAVVYLGSTITSAGLANGGDVVILSDDTDTEVDAVSYGTNVTAFDPAVTGVGDGSSIERTDHAVDTDTAADWSTNDAPTPGT